MEYRADERELDAGTFLALVNAVWPGTYDPDRPREALKRTMNLTALAMAGGWWAA